MIKQTKKAQQWMEAHKNEKNESDTKNSDNK